MPLNREFLAELGAKPIFCFTSDIDWADDEMIAFAYSIFDEYEVPITPFLTHDSEFLKRRFANFEFRVGLHPNFLSGSTHGEDINQILDHVVSLNPSSTFFRCHHYYDTTEVTEKFRQRDFGFDSNINFAPSSNLVPLVHESGLIRYPVFLGDGTLLSNFSDGDLTDLLMLLSAPGLKIFNFHPVHVCLNTPNTEHYREFKKSGRSWRDWVHQGTGTRSNLIRLLDAVRRECSMGIHYLWDLHHMATNPEAVNSRSAKTADTTWTPASQVPISAEEYDKLDNAERATFKRASFNQLAAKGIYGTSRDYNLRELEIDFIIEAIRSFAAQLGRKPRIVDLGCGNGYTTLRIAAELEADILGLDFAEALIAEAQKLSAQFADCGHSLPRFETADIAQGGLQSSFFDVVVTERVLLNLVDRSSQENMLKQVHGLLASGGMYVLIEGNSDGLQRLNAVRQDVGLQPIPDRGFDNVGALKFREAEFEALIEKLFFTIERRNFGTYFLISRVAHPLFVAPEAPEFAHKLNFVARQLQSRCPDLFNGGHLIGRVLKKRNEDQG